MAPRGGHARRPGWTLRSTRRGFLRLAGSGAALSALGQIGWGSLAPAARASPEGPSFFDPVETEILTQVMERIVDTGVPEAPRVRDIGAVASVDRLCRGLDPELSGPLPLVLRLFEWGPIFFDLHFSRFTRMDDAEKDASLRAWMQSRLELRRLAFLGVRNLCFFGYYGQQETWPLIGYRGPLLGRPS